jgi:hypothetical protein
MELKKELKKEAKKELNLLDKTTSFLEQKFEKIKIKKHEKNLNELKDKPIKKTIERSNKPMYFETSIQFIDENSKFWRNEL